MMCPKCNNSIKLEDKITICKYCGARIKILN